MVRKKTKSKAAERLCVHCGGKTYYLDTRYNASFVGWRIRIDTRDFQWDGRDGRLFTADLTDDADGHHACVYVCKLPGCVAACLAMYNLVLPEAQRGRQHYVLLSSRRRCVGVRTNAPLTHPAAHTSFALGCARAPIGHEHRRGRPFGRWSTA